MLVIAVAIIKVTVPHVNGNPPPIPASSSTLTNAIANSYQETLNILNGALGYNTTGTPSFSVSPLSWFVPDIGTVGDDFENKVKADKAQIIVDSLYGTVGSGTAGPEANYERCGSAVDFNPREC